jgi:hypothetical protein
MAVGFSKSWIISMGKITQFCHMMEDNLTGGFVIFHRGLIFGTSKFTIYTK